MAGRVIFLCIIPDSRGRRKFPVKQDIHPKYIDCTVNCACGNSFQTRATRPTISIEICSACHPFYTGKQKFVDTEGRVERFQKKYGKVSKAN